MIDMAGRVALVTGAASGIGAATATLLASRGAVVVGADRHARGEVVELDVTDEAAVDELVARVVADHGRLDMAANVAGTSGVLAAVTDIDTADWHDTLRVNLDGLMFCLRAELRVMKAAGRGSVVNVASSAGRMGVAGMAGYAASKHAVLGLTRTAALELAGAGVRVNAVSPGGVRTPMLEAFANGDPEQLERMGRRAPMGRLGEAHEVAEAIAWLLSDSASFVTGASVEADGGVAAV